MVVFSNAHNFLLNVLGVLVDGKEDADSEGGFDDAGKALHEDCKHLCLLFFVDTVKNVCSDG